VNVTVSVLVVNHNGGDLLERCLTSVQRAAGSWSLQTVVVDNASTDGSDIVSDAVQPTVLIRIDENVGFARANNIAAEHADGRYWLLINTDCFLHQGAVDALVRRMDGDSRIAIAAPRLLNADGTLQRSCHNFPRPVVLFLEQSSLWKLATGRRWARRLSITTDHDRSMEVDWATAACWLVRPEAWRQSGGFDPGFFFYWEEADLCYRLREQGWRVWFEPAAEATHLGGASTGSPGLLQHFFKGLYRFYDRHYPPRARPLARGIVSTMALWKMTRAAVRSRSAPTPQARRQADSIARVWAAVLRS